MEFLVLFNLLILMLFFLSRQLTSEIYLLIYRVTKSEKISSYVLAMIFFPGVFVHEMSHLITAKILFVRVGKVSFFPKKEGDYIKLGSVSVAESNFLKEFFIGVAPLVVGILFILSSIYFLLTMHYEFKFVVSIAVLFGIFLVSNTMYASRKDFQAALPFLVTIITFGIILFVIGIRFPIISLDWLSGIQLSKVFYTASLYLIVPVVIDFAIVLILRFFNRMW